MIEKSKGVMQLEERLQKVLAQAGYGSRRKCEELIRAGRVRVNGQVVQQMGVKVDAERDRIEVDGKEITKETQVYLMLHKPRHVVTTMRDPQGRKTVADLVKDVPYRLFPVGRLDYESEGLLLMTNDGELAQLLLHPRYGVRKVYHVWVKGIPTEEELEPMRRGMVLEEGPVQPAEVKRLPSWKEGVSLFEVRLSEGKKRQIRRMFQQMGYEVVRLKRIAHGNIRLGHLQPGSYRYLTAREVQELKSLCRRQAVTKRTHIGSGT